MNIRREIIRILKANPAGMTSNEISNQIRISWLDTVKAINQLSQAGLIQKVSKNPRPIWKIRLTNLK